MISNTLDSFIPIIPIAVIAFFIIKPFVRLLHDLSGERNRFTRFFFSQKYQIRIIDEGILYKPYFQKEITITWDMVKKVRLSLFRGIAVSWSGIEKRGFWAIRRGLWLDRFLPDFSEKVHLIVEKSVNAKIDRRIHKFIQIPNEQKFLTLRKRLGFFLSLMFFLAGFSLVSIILNGNNWFFLINFTFILLFFGLLTNIFSLIMYRWDDNKWGYFYDIYFLLFLFLVGVYWVLLILANGMLVMRVMLILLSFMLPACIFVMMPRLGKKHILPVFVAGILLVYSIGNAALFDSRIKTERFQRIDSFMGYTAGWFPDGSKIYVAGLETKALGITEAQNKFHIFDASSAKPIATLLTDTVCSSSFHWSPDGSKLALIEYLKDEKDKLFFFDTETLKKEFLLSGYSIQLHDYGCWNVDSDRLAGTYLEEEGGEEGRKVFIVDVHTREFTLFKEANTSAAFWFSDGSIGLLTEIDKKDNDKYLYKFSVLRIGEDQTAEVVCKTEEWRGRVSLSPRGNYLVQENVGDGYPLLIDIFKATQNILVQQVLRQRNIYWAPDGEKVILLFKKDTQDKLYVYKPGTRELRKIIYEGSKIERYKHTVNWSGDSNWFIVYPEAIFPSPIIFSYDGSSSIRISGAGNLLSPLYLFSFMPKHDGSQLAYLDFNYLQYFPSTLHTTILIATITK